MCSGSPALGWASYPPVGPPAAITACPAVLPQERAAAGPNTSDALRHDLPFPAGPHRPPQLH